MIGAKVGKRYAVAIYDIAAGENKVTEIYETLNSIMETYLENLEFKNLVAHPLISKEDKKESPYEQVEGKLDTIDLCLHNAQKEIAELVRRMKESPEVCPDEEDADKAIQDALDNFFVNDLLKQKPIGDA